MSILRLPGNRSKMLKYNAEQENGSPAAAAELLLDSFLSACGPVLRPPTPSLLPTVLTNHAWIVSQNPKIIVM